MVDVRVVCAAVVFSLLTACSGGGSVPNRPATGTPSNSFERGSVETSATTDALFIPEPFGTGYNGNGNVLGYAVPATGGAPALSATLTVDSLDLPNINGQPAGLTGPYGIAFDSSGNLWIGDGYTDAIFAYSNPELGGSKPLTGRTLAAPDGAGQNGVGELGFDKSGNLWAVLTPHGSGTPLVQGFSIPPGTGAPQPIAADKVPTNGSFAFDQLGNLWTEQSDENAGGADSIVEYSLANGTPKQIGPTIVFGNQQFPDDLAFDAAGNLWVAVLPPSSAADTIEEYNSTSGALENSFVAADSFDLAYMAFDPQGHLWLTASTSSSGATTGLTEYAVPSGTILESPAATGFPSLATSGYIAFGP